MRYLPWTIVRIITSRTVWAAALVLALVITVGLGIWFGWKVLIGWKALISYINPQDATDRKDAVQVYAIIVAGVVAAITATVGLLNLRLTRRNLEQQRELEAQRAEQQRELEAQRSQGAALQSYYEQIGKLITDEDLLNTERKEIRELARGQTLTVLQQIDGERKRSLLTFLHEAGLIGAENPAVTLIGADFRGAKLYDGADFRGANLQGAAFDYGGLEGVNMAYLQGATMPDGAKHT